MEEMQRHVTWRVSGEESESLSETAERGVDNRDNDLQCQGTVYTASYRTAFHHGTGTGQITK